MKIKLPTIVCTACGWTWTPRKPDVRQCPNPKCHSLYFDKPKEAK